MSQPEKAKTSYLSSVGLALVVLFVGFGDGIAYGLVRRWSLPSPWVILMPLAGLALAWYFVRAGRLPPARTVGLMAAVAWAAAIGLGLQLIFLDRINVAGYVQLTLFVLLLILVKSVFVGMDVVKASKFGRALFIAHLFLCSYVVSAWVVWQLAGIDISVVSVLSSRSVSAYYGYRPAGWSVEPAWAAFSISVSFLGAYHLLPQARRSVFIALVAAALALQSATLFAFLAVATVLVFAGHHRRLVLIPIAMVVLLAIANGAWLVPRFAAVAGGSDPSTQMRINSAGVAWAVVAQSFPAGVGYGKFRDAAVYDDQIARLVDLEEFTYYKSDLSVLNLVAELGVAGLLLVIFVFRLLGLGSFLMPTVFLVMVAVLSGTILLPVLLVLAAVVAALQGSVAAERSTGMSRVHRLPAGHTPPGSGTQVRQPEEPTRVNSLHGVPR